MNLLALDCHCYITSGLTSFLCYPDVKSAQAALDLLNGYKLLEKPLIIEFGRERSKETDAQTDGPSQHPVSTKERNILQ